MRKFEPDLAERLAAQAKAKTAMLERLKPKPAVQAQVVIPWDERELQRIRDLTTRVRPKRPQPAKIAPVFILRAFTSSRSSHAPPAPQEFAGRPKRSAGGSGNGTRATAAAPTARSSS